MAHGLLLPLVVMSKPTDFQTIDPTALATVAGGRSSGGSSGGIDESLATALSGIADSLAALKGQQGGGMDMGQLMMMMTMMGGGSSAPAAAPAAPQPKAWNYDQATGTWTSTY